MWQGNNVFTTYVTSKTVESAGCNAISFENTGNVTLRINQSYKMVPGAVVNLNMVMPDIQDMTNYYVSFDKADPDSTGTNQEVVVITTFMKSVGTGTKTARNCEML